MEEQKDIIDLDTSVKKFEMYMRTKMTWTSILNRHIPMNILETEANILRNKVYIILWKHYKNTAIRFQINNITESAMILLDKYKFVKNSKYTMEWDLILMYWQIAYKKRYK